MASPLDDVCCGSIPVAGLPLLADLRGLSAVRVRVEGEKAWLYWTAGDTEVLRRVLPIRGAEIFARREGVWRRPGESLPVFDVPEDAGALPLERVVTPGRVQPLVEENPSFERVRLTLVRDPRPRPTTAVCCRLPDLATWADGVPSQRLTSLHAARWGALVLLVGERAPLLATADRYWGRAVLTPLGYCPEPALPERDLAAALGLSSEEIAVLSIDGGADVVRRDAFEPLTRAGIRLALQEQR